MAKGTINPSLIQEAIKNIEGKPKPVMPTNPHPDLEESLVKCKSCDKAIMSYISTSSKVDDLWFQAKCPYCDGTSWRVPYKGRLKIAGIEGETRISGYDGNLILLEVVTK